MTLAVFGASSKRSLRARLPVLAARARAAAVAGKALDAFLRESGREWPDAPCTLAVHAASLSDLEAKLTLAVDLLDGDATRLEQHGLVYAGAAASVEPPRPRVMSCAGVPPSEGVADVDPDTASLVTAIFLELTGFDAVDLDQHLADDLGVDSIKHAQIIETSWDRFGVHRDPTLTIAQHPTLRHMAAFLSQHGRRPTPVTVVETPVVTRISEGEVRVRLDVLERTACPHDLLDPREAASHGVLPAAERIRSLGLRAGAAHLLGQRVRLAGNSAITPTAPLTAWPLATRLDGDLLTVRLDGPPRLHLADLTGHWRALLGGRAPSLLDVSAAITDKFLSAVEVEDPDALAALRGRPVIWLSNHQTAIETYIFPLIASALSNTVVLGVDMRDHGIPWADSLRELMSAHRDLPEEMRATSRTVDTADPTDMLRVLPELERDLRAGGRSLQIAVTGLRETAARQVLAGMSAVWLDLALAVDCPVVPVRMLGGLPLEDAGHAHDLPVGLGTQRIHLGRPMGADALRALDPRERTGHVLRVLNRLGRPDLEVPSAPDTTFAQEVGRWASHAGVPDILAVLYQVLERHRPLDLEMRRGEHAFANPVDAVVAAGRLSRGLREAVALALPDTVDGAWLADIASLVMGSRVDVSGNGSQSIATKVTA